jgi:hypothetical protein
MKKLLVTILLIAFAFTSKAQCIEQDAFNSNKWHLGFHSPSKQKALFQISDSNGIVIYSSRVKVFRGYNTPIIHIKTFKPGIYTMTVKDLVTVLITKK